uniref:protein NYNRIN-like n=1 Tax=Pristiophorus japonicus TaxID=55135 RepID=UPI00398EDF63
MQETVFTICRNRHTSNCLKETSDRPVNIWSDSAYTINTMLSLPLYLKNDYRTIDGKALVHGPWLRLIWSYLKQRSQTCFIGKVAAHRKGGPHSERNSRAYRATKDAAIDGEIEDIVVEPCNAVSKACPIDHLDLKSMQQQYWSYAVVSTWHEEGRPLPQPTTWAPNTILATAPDSDEQLLMLKREPNTCQVVCVPPEVGQELLSLFHSHPTAGHYSALVTFYKVAFTAWWPSMRETINQYMVRCLLCLQHNPPACTNRALLQSAPPPQGPWTHLQIDFIGPLPQAQGNFQHVVDQFTKWIEAFPCRSNTKITAAKTLLNHVFCRCGVPVRVDSDQGSHFTGNIFTHLQEMLGIKHKLHIAHHPPVIQRDRKGEQDP